ncbi:hypothetical protein V0288_23580 [Pannus brasiliensis CCIBt3594]|uniref:Uncharacterized protein n=1 Tax=Pannus brasiliensis CCIBt3594 TaxID=1427578 RepID=A0AAW9QZX6_9CHRO
MIPKKSLWQMIAVLGGLTVSFSFLPTAAKAGTAFNNTLSPAPENNPTRTNTVNGTTIPVWTIDGGLQLTLPSEPLSTTPSQRVDSTSGSDRTNTTPPSERVEPVSPDGSRNPPSERVEPNQRSDAGRTVIWIPSGLGRTSGRTAGPSFDPLPGSRIEIDNPNGRNVSGTTVTPNSPIERRTIEPTTPTTPEAVPSDRTNTTPVNPAGDTRIERTNPDGTYTPGTTVPDDTENPNLQMQIETNPSTPSTVPSRPGPSSGTTGGPSRDPLPGQQGTPSNPTGSDLSPGMSR